MSLTCRLVISVSFLVMTRSDVCSTAWAGSFMYCAKPNDCSSCPNCSAYVSSLWSTWMLKSLNRCRLQLDCSVPRDVLVQRRTFHRMPQTVLDYQAGRCPAVWSVHHRSSRNHTHTQPFNSLLSGTTRVGRYQKKHSPTHTHPDHRTSFIIFLHVQRSMASSLFSLRAWQSSRKTSVQVLFGLPLGLGPSTSYSMHFFTQSSSFRSTCPYQRSLFCCNTNAMSSIPSLSAPFCWQTQW